jgi:hypothetical protein
MSVTHFPIFDPSAHTVGTNLLPLMASGNIPTDADVLPNHKKARPALVKDEPLHAINKPEHYAVSTKCPGGTPTGAISKIPTVSPSDMMMMHQQQHQDESNLVGMAGLSQKPKRAEERNNKVLKYGFL